MRHVYILNNTLRIVAIWNGDMYAYALQELVTKWYIYSYWKTVVTYHPIRPNEPFKSIQERLVKSYEIALEKKKQIESHKQRPFK